MAALPKLSRGLTLVRYGVLATLLLLALEIVFTIKLVMAPSPDSFTWMRYLLAANGLIALAMFIGAASAIPELTRLHLRVRSLVVAAIGFAIATAVLVWSYRTLTSFVDAMLDPEIPLDDKLARIEDFKNFPKLAILRSIAYSIGLIALIGSVEVSAQAIDKLALRDEAGSMRRALIVMLVGEIFQQLTFGLAGGGVGITGLLAELLIAGFWIYCHVRLARFLYNAAGLINEAAEIPIAIVNAEKSEPVARPSQPRPAAARPSGPKLSSVPKPIVPTPVSPIVPTRVAPMPPPAPIASAPKPFVPTPGAPVAGAQRPVVPTPAVAKPAIPTPPAPIVAVDPRPPATTPAVSSTGAPDDGPKFLR